VMSNHFYVGNLLIDSANEVALISLITVIIFG
jgi:hypothetical protein